MSGSRTAATSLAAARARARAASAASSVKLAPAVVLTAEEKADRLIVTAHVERSHRAFGSLYSALSEDLRLQVAHLPQGWAYGLWMWLERKFQSTEADSVGVLLTRWVTLAQTEDESFDQYRARVNELAALLKHAKQQQTPEMYCLFLLKRLQPRYTSAVLALENGVMLKNLAAGTVDWDAVTALINNHERSERQFAEATASGAKAMAARSASSRSDPASSPSRSVAASTATSSGTSLPSAAAPGRGPRDPLAPVEEERTIKWHPCSPMARWRPAAGRTRHVACVVPTRWSAAHRPACPLALAGGHACRGSPAAELRAARGARRLSRPRRMR
jgi:hypothetical protein